MPAIALVLIANFIPLYSVLAQDWPVVYVVMLFWFDALMFIAFTAIRILIAPVPDDLSLTLARKTAIAAVTLKVFYKTVVATVTMDIGKGQWVNCFRTMMNLAGLDFNLPNDGPVKDAGIRWRGGYRFSEAEGALHGGPSRSSALLVAT